MSPDLIAIIVRLNDPTHVIDISDVFSLRVEEDYFSDFHALTRLEVLGQDFAKSRKRRSF